MRTRATLSRRTFLQRSAVATVALAGSGAAVPTIREAFAQAGDYELVCNSNDVNVRDAPGLSGTVIGTINTGGIVSVTGETVFADGYGWLPVFVHGSAINGYVARDFFDRPDGIPGWVRGTPIHVASNGVNMRSGAGLGFSVIGTFNTGTNGVVNEAPIFADGYNWYHVTVDNVTGYMAADFLAEGHTGGDPGNGEFAIGSFVQTTDSMNLRAGPGLGHGVISVRTSAEVATVIDGPAWADGYGWYQVEIWADGAVGWLAGEFLQLAQLEPGGTRHRIFDGPLNLRQWGGIGAPVVTTLSTGAIVVIADSSFVNADGYTWMNVYVESNPSLTGWIAQGFSEEI